MEDSNGIDLLTYDTDRVCVLATRMLILILVKLCGDDFDFAVSSVIAHLLLTCDTSPVSQFLCLDFCVTKPTSGTVLSAAQNQSSTKRMVPKRNDFYNGSLK